MKTEPSKLSNGKHNELERMSASDLMRALKNMVKVLHPDILICRLITSLMEARRKLQQISIDVAHDEAQGKNAISKSQYSQKNQYYTLELQKVRALEHVVDLCLTEAQGPYICRTRELNTLVCYAVAYINTGSSKRRTSILKDLGTLRNKYERSIPYHIAAATLIEPQTPEDVEKVFTLVYEENQKYLVPVFSQHLGFSWESFIKFVGTLGKFSFNRPGFVSRQVLRKDLKDIQEFDEILHHLEYNRDRARSRLKLSPSVRTGMNGRLLFAHPIPSTISGLVISTRLLCDSLNWYVYSYRKKSGAFRKAKGHLFEDRIAQTLETHSWRIIAQNLVLIKAIVPNENKAEYDIIAVKGRYMLIIEAKAYTPETRISGYSEAQRLKRGAAFARKLRLKTEFIGNNIPEIPELSAGVDCNILIPVLLSTYPFVAQSVFEGVAVLTEPELPGLLVAPDSIVDSARIHLHGK